MAEQEKDQMAEIEGQLAELSKQKDEINSKMLELTKTYDGLHAHKSLARKVAQMTPAERAILGIPEPEETDVQDAQSVGVEGIESHEEVNGTSRKSASE